MAGYCSSCGAKLGFLRQVTGNGLCSNCEKEAREAHRLARVAYSDALKLVSSSDGSLDEFQRVAPEIRQQAALTEAEVAPMHRDTYRSLIGQVLSDDFLSEEEEQKLGKVAVALGFDPARFSTEFEDFLPRMVVSRVNAGRLPTEASPRIMLKKGEVCHAETGASLLKSVVVREWQGRSSGYSFRVMKGVRYHVGGSRGQSVVVGTRIETEDVGVLSVTSQRAVFIGAKKTVEHLYSKLVNVNVFDDGISFNVTNRQATTTLHLKAGYGDVVASIINAASAAAS